MKFRRMNIATNGQACTGQYCIHAIFLNKTLSIDGLPSRIMIG
jgi:hypothetical protein